jgi:hypothetical protein
MISILAAALMTTWMGGAPQSGTAMSQDEKMDAVAKGRDGRHLHGLYRSRRGR